MLASLAISAAGVLFLLLASMHFEANTVEISGISNAMEGRLVSVNAKVLGAYQSKGTAFMELYDGTGRIKAVCFEPKGEMIKFFCKNCFASFEGRVQIYENAPEMVIERVSEWE